jgi:dihydroneopterin aldolase
LGISLTQRFLKTGWIWMKLVILKPFPVLQKQILKECLPAAMCRIKYTGKQLRQPEAVAWQHWMLKDIWEQWGCIDLNLIKYLLKLDGEISIELKSLSFFSFHGLYEEEKRLGGEFIVDATVKISAGKAVHSVDDTINYSDLYELIKSEMNQPRELLETLAQSIADKILKDFAMVREIEIRIEKKNPPITGFSGKIAVRYKLEKKGSD